VQAADLRAVAHALHTELLELRVIKRRECFAVDTLLSIPSFDIRALQGSGCRRASPALPRTTPTVGVDAQDDASARQHGHIFAMSTPHETWV
jgi:hypothetical protein